MPQPTNSFRTLGGGVPVHYDRLPSPHHYGSRGQPFTFHCKADFETLLDNAFRDIWLYTRLGKAEVITSAGAYVNKPGQHGNGRALDIDGIFWSNKTFVTLHAGWQGQDRNFYFGIEAVLRLHFGVVLDYEYNAPHRDHFHIDDSQGLGFRKQSRSKVRSLQGMLNHVWGNNVHEDGVWGDQTAEAVSEVLAVAGLPGPITNQAQWLLLMKKTAEKAFGT
jgi:Extensin-like protein C-terminus